MSNIVLILGGARSGKSEYAEKLARKRGLEVYYLAAGKAVDEEMKRRIEIHRKKRPASWKTLEVNGNLPDILFNAIDGCRQRVVIFDCVTIYVAEMMTTHGLDEKRILGHIGKAVKYMKKSSMTLVVSNEVGMGVVPPYVNGRKYRDTLGRVNQLLAKEADKVYMMMAGIPVIIKGKGER